MTTYINLSSQLVGSTGSAYYQMASSGNYSLAGSGAVPGGVTAITFYMANAITATVDGGSFEFGVPVSFAMNHFGGSGSVNGANVLNLTGIWNMNESVVFNTYGNNTAHTSVVNFGTSGTSLTFNASGSNSAEVMRLAGLGSFVINNASTSINVNLNPITGGIHQYAPAGRFTVVAGTIYAVVGTEMIDEDVLVVSTYMVMDPNFTLRFDAGVNLELAGLTSQINAIVVNSPGVIIQGTDFTSTFAVTINNSDSLEMDNCTFSPTAGDAITVTGPGSAPNATFTLGPGTVITPVNGYSILTVGSHVNVSVDSGATVNLPNPYTFTEFDDPSIQALTYGFSSTGTVDFGTWNASPLNLNITSGTETVTVNAQQGVSATVASGATLKFSGSNIVANSANDNTALVLSGSGTTNFSTSSPTGIYAGDGMDLLNGSNGSFNANSGKVRFYLNSDSTGVGTWWFGVSGNGNSGYDGSGYSSQDLTNIVTYGVYLNGGYSSQADFISDLTTPSYSDVTEGTYNVNVDFGTTFPIYASYAGGANPGGTWADAHTVTSALLQGVVGDVVPSQTTLNCTHASVTLQAQYYDCVSSSFTTPLIIASGTVTSGTAGVTLFNISNTGTVPYTGTLVTPGNAYIYLTENTYSFDSGTSTTWYNSPVYFVSNNDTNFGGDSSSYTINSINALGLELWALNSGTVPVVSLNSTYRVTVNIPSSCQIDLAGGTMSNSGDTVNYYPPLTLPQSGSGVLNLISEVIFAVSGATGTVTVNNGSAISGADNALVLYKDTGTADFSTLDREIEYAAGVVLDNANTFTFTNVSSNLELRNGVTLGGGMYAATVQGSFTGGLTLNTTSSATTTVHSISYTYPNSSGDLVILGSGQVTFTGSSTLHLNGVSNINALIDVGSNDSNGSSNLTLSSSSVTITGSGSYLFGIEGYTSGSINTGNLDLSAATHTPIYWPTLSSTTSNTPYTCANSSEYTNGSYAFVAVDYDPTVTPSIMHTASEYRLDSSNISYLTYTIASGNANLTHSLSSGSVTSALTPTALVWNGVNYASPTNYLSDIFITSPVNTWGNSYYGSLDTVGDLSSVNTGGSPSGTALGAYSGITSTYRKMSMAVDFSPADVYVGNSTIQVSFGTLNIGITTASFGIVPSVSYSITDCVSAPSSMCESPSSISVDQNDDSQAMITVSLMGGAAASALPLYIYPITTSGSYKNAAEVLDYRNSGSTYVSYATYTGYTDATNLVYVPINSSSKCFYVEFNSSVHSEIPDDLYFKLQLNLVPGGPVDSESALYTSRQILIDYTSPNYLYPVLSTDGSSLVGTSSSTIVYGAFDDEQVGTFNQVTNYTGSNVSYTLDMYVNMELETYSGDPHSVTITGTTDGFTYTYGPVGSHGSGSTAYTLADNGDGTALVTIPSANSGRFFAVNITVTTNQQLDNYDFMSNQEFDFTLLDSENQNGFGNSPVSPTTQYASSNFSMPPSVIVGLGCFTESSDFSSTWKSSGTEAANFSKGGSQMITVMTVGTVVDSFVYRFNVALHNSASSQSANSCLMAYSLSNISFSSGNRGTQNMTFNQDYRISGDSSYYAITPGMISYDSSCISIDSVTAITLTDSSSEHVLTFPLGLGVATNASNVTTTGSTSSDDYVQTPASFSTISYGDEIAYTTDLCMNFSVGASSIPYNTMSDMSEHASFDVNWVITGSSQAPGTEGFSETGLAIGTDVYVYGSAPNSTTGEFSGSNDIAATTINSTTYANADFANTLYIVQGNTSYEYINLYYFVSATGEPTSALNSCDDYSGLPSLVASKQLVAYYNFSSAPTGEVDARIFGMGDWQMRSDNVGNLIFKYLGATSGDSGAGGSFIIAAPTSNVQSTINTTVL